MACAGPDRVRNAAAADVRAQTASPLTPPPTFPRAAPFAAERAPLSAAQQRSMVTIPAGRYTIGSPANHPLANRAAMPEHAVDVRAFRIDRT